MPDIQDKKRVLVTGGTGYIGRRLTQQLVEGGKLTVRLLVRNRVKVQVTLAEKVEIVEGSTFDEVALKEALSGVDVAYYLIHSMGSDKDYRDLDKQSAENFRDGCIEAGVKKIIYLGGLGVKESASKHLLSRIETGEVLAAKSSEIQTIWFRAGVIIGSGSASFEIMRNLCQKLPMMITPRWVRVKTQPIGIKDVIAYLMAALDLDYKKDLVVDIGADTLSFQQMMKKAAEVMGLKRMLIPVPVLSPKLSSYWLILFTPVPFKLASALVEGLKSETVLQNENASLYFSQIEPEEFKTSVRGAIHELEQNQVLSRWCDSSGGTACDITEYDNPAGAVLRDIRTVPYDNEEEQMQVF